MRTKKFDKCIINEKEEDIRKELKEIREDFMELKQKCSTDIDDIIDRHIPLHIRSKLCCFVD